MKYAVQVDSGASYVSSAKTALGAIKEALEFAPPEDASAFTVSVRGVHRGREKKPVITGTEVA